MTDPARDQSPEPLSLLETRILMVLVPGKLHGYGIAGQLQRRDPDGPRIFPTNLYRRLYDLVDRGLIEPAGVELDDTGRSRKNFAITDLGRRSLAVAAERLGEIVEQLRSQAQTSPGSISE